MGESAYPYVGTGSIGGNGMTRKLQKMQRFWNGMTVIIYGVFLPLSCLFMALGEKLPYALLFFMFALPYIEQAGMDHLRRKEMSR
ncbi:hypothetical protein AB432_003480 [Brevibacillus brevis]|uniref:Uncharacterized protein n=2 Tax=Brevibacillus TaxID=55080 RepID=A0A2Z4MCE3_BREBE|nr:hypothetical protein AB432_003480 [Brevibacillus brevis]NRR23406.1 hypothetical protein [Brevibacillus sp. MS2.2]